jgi:hypothetical protein
MTKRTSLWRGMVLGLRRRTFQVRAYYRLARTTFQVLRTLDAESLMTPAPVPVPAFSGGRRRNFVPHTGFVA